MTTNFRSDNESPVHADIMQAIIDANQGTAHAYAEDQWSLALNQRFSEIFDCEATVLPISTGTAANSSALACVTPPWGSVFCHRFAHIMNDESGAPEFFGGGLRLVAVDGDEGKMQPDQLLSTLKANEGHGVHSYIPSSISLTQSTESGTVYTADEISALTAIARQQNMQVHMDGARFANAVASLGCHPADVTWKAGINMMSFGASKNGAMAAETLVIFNNPGLFTTAERHRKRSGHLLSKMRYLSAQLLAYLNNNLWLDLANHANQQASRFARAIEAHPTASLEYPVEANEVFLCWNDKGFTQLESAGIEFHRWPGRDDLARFVFAHSTTDKEMQLLVETLNQA